MKKLNLISVLLLVALVSIVALADDSKGTQKNCPIMGNPINKEIFVDYKDMRVFFCCPGCDGKFMESPDEHLKKMAEKGELPMKLKAQSFCPVSGETLKNKETFVDVDGKRIYVCCGGCIEKVKSKTAKYLKIIAKKGEFVESVK